MPNQGGSAQPTEHLRMRSIIATLTPCFFASTAYVSQTTERRPAVESEVAQHLDGSKRNEEHRREHDRYGEAVKHAHGDGRRSVSNKNGRTTRCALLGELRDAVCPLIKGYCLAWATGATSLTHSAMRLCGRARRPSHCSACFHVPSV